MGLFDSDSDVVQAAKQYSDIQNKSNITHELIVAAASYEADKAYEKQVAANGRPTSYAKAKEIISAFTGAFIDKEIETRGLDFIDREKAKNEATKQVEQAVGESGQF